MIVAALALLSFAPADLVIVNARIWSDGLKGFASFAAVRDGRFTYVGSPKRELVGPKTLRVDAKGCVVLPGLIDAHTHMLSGGTRLSQLDLRPAKDKLDFIRRIADYAKSLRADQWIQGGGWSVESWPDRESPHKEWVDAVSAGRPLFLSRMDGHSALVNSATLRLAGITKDSPMDPPGGKIERDANGEPTGILVDTAMSNVAARIPQATAADRLAALRRAMAEANRYGVTSVGDIPGIGDLGLYEQLAKGPMSVRFTLYPVTPQVSASASSVKDFEGKQGWLQVRGFKAYMDGSLGSRSAYMREPFSDNPPSQEGNRGLPRSGMLDGSFEANCQAAQANGLQTICHAIGDEANHQLLDILERAYGPALKAARCRDEHTQHLLPADIPRFARLGVIASMQPYHKADDARYCEQRIGLERSKSSYAFQSLLKSGAVVAFGSDWPVVSINPFLGIEAAVTGKTLDGKLWMTQENITVAEALRCYTSRAAYAMFVEKEIGSIAPGYRADFILLNQSPFAPKPKWSQIRPVEVWVDGKRVAKSP